jgi:hypothetical protein
MAVNTYNEEVKFCLENQMSYTWVESPDELRFGDYHGFQRVQH